MGNSTQVFSPKKMHKRLTELVDSYREQLRADERRLLDAMLDYERSCWVDSARRAA